MSIKNLSIQIYSDLHIEVWNKLPAIPVNAKYLFLVGDICNINHPLFYKFFDYCSSNWVKTFYITGNHEYYIKKRNYNELLFEYKYRIEQRYKNIFCLNNSFVSLDEENINIYGAIFWTIPPFPSTSIAKLSINDYNYISYFKQEINAVVDLDINYVKHLAEESFTSLEKYLNENDKKTIVMTHFPPHRTGTADPKYLAQERQINSYFSWPDGTLLKLNLNNVLAWISGHSHWSYDFVQNGVRLISNQLGYRSEIGKTNLNQDGVYEIIFS